MNFKDFRDQYSEMSVQELLGLINTKLVSLDRHVSDGTLERYQNTIKTLSRKKKVYNDLVSDKYKNKDLAYKHKLNLKEVKNYRTPLILLDIIERRPGYNPQKWKMDFNEFKDKFGSLSKYDLMTVAEKICKQQGREFCEKSLETRAESILAISRKNRNFYTDLTNTKRNNKNIAKKYNYSPRTIRKYRKALLLFGVTKPKNNNHNNYDFDLNIEDLLLF